MECALSNPWKRGEADLSTRISRLGPGLEKMGGGWIHLFDLVYRGTGSLGSIKSMKIPLYTLVRGLLRTSFCFCDLQGTTSHRPILPPREAYKDQQQLSRTDYSVVSGLAPCSDRLASPSGGFVSAR